LLRSGVEGRGEERGRGEGRGRGTGGGGQEPGLNFLHPIPSSVTSDLFEV